MNEITKAFKGLSYDIEANQYPLYFFFAYWFNYTPEQVRELTPEEIYGLQEGIKIYGKQLAEARQWLK